jgi:excisionase family DNA binding protein
MEKPTMVTVTKAAKILGISRKLLSDLIEQKKIPSHNYNYPFTIKRTDLNEYIEAPVKPERVSHPHFAFDPDGKWYSHIGRYTEFDFRGTYNEQCRLVVSVIQDDKPIYATDPTAWLASQAEKKEGKNCDGI